MLITIYGRPTWPWNALALHSSDCRDLAMVGPCGLPTKGTRVWSKRRLQIHPSHPTRQNIYNHPSGRILGLISPYPQTTNIQMLHPQNTTPELSDDDRSGSVARSANRRRSTRGELVFPSILDHGILIRNFLQPAINAVAQRANVNDQTWTMYAAHVPPWVSVSPLSRLCGPYSIAHHCFFCSSSMYLCR